MVRQVSFSLSSLSKTYIAPPQISRLHKTDLHKRIGGKAFTPNVGTSPGAVSTRTAQPLKGSVSLKNEFLPALRTVIGTSGKWLLGGTGNMLLGAAAWTGVHAVASGGASLRVLQGQVSGKRYADSPWTYSKILDRTLSSMEEGLEVCPRIPENVMEWCNLSRTGLLNDGLCVTEDNLKSPWCNPEQQKNMTKAWCKSDYKAIAVLDGVFGDDVRRFVGERSSITAVLNEVFWRGLVQDLIFKRGLGSIVRQFSPKKADALVDSKVYAACRILFTSWISSAIATPWSNQVGERFAGEAWRDQWLMEAVCGLLKETLGLSAAIGVRIINNQVVNVLSPGETLPDDAKLALSGFMYGRLKAKSDE